MEHKPSYTDGFRFRTEPSWRDSLSNELYHYGVKGMRWGVSRYQTHDGTWKKKAPIGSSARVRQKQEMFKSKINSDGILGRGDLGVIRRNTINDWRRGRVAQLETKAQNREAREAYRKNKSKDNKKRLHATTRARLIKNGIAAFDTPVRGHYNRMRQEGHSIPGAVVRTGLTSTGVPITPISEVARGKKYKKQYIDNRNRYAKRTNQQSRI